MALPTEGDMLAEHMLEQQAIRMEEQCKLETQQRQLQQQLLLQRMVMENDLSVTPRSVQLNDLERLAYLEQLHNMDRTIGVPLRYANLPPLPHLLFEPNPYLQQQEGERREVNTDLIVAQAMEQARLAQLLQRFQP